MRFCEKLILLRKRKGMTQTEFSRAVGVSRQSVYKWESGQSYPEAEKLLELRRLFGISIDILLDETASLPFILSEEAHIEYQVKQEKITTPPVPVKPEAAPAQVQRAQPTIKKEVEPPREEIRRVDLRRTVSTPVSLPKKTKKPSTLKEIVSTFFPKRRF